MMTSAANAYEGRIVVVTGVGGAGQVGIAIARGFAERGAHVHLVGHAAGEITARTAELTAAGFTAVGHDGDLTDTAQVDSIADTIRRRSGDALHAVVHCAGGFGASGAVAESDPAVWYRMLAINATTAYVATRATLPFLRRGGGALLYFASAAVLPGGTTTGLVAYAAAKMAVVSLMRTVAEEERPHGVRANALAPNAIRTAANRGMSPDTKFVELEQCVDAALYLCSSAASAITGQVIALE